MAAAWRELVAVPNPTPEPSAWEGIRQAAAYMAERLSRSDHIANYRAMAEILGWDRRRKYVALMHQRVLGLGQNELERGLVEILERRCDRKTADEFRDQAVLQRVLRLDLAEDLALLSILGRDDLGAEADRARSAARRNDLLEAGERAAAHEQDIGGVDLQEFLLRMFAATLRWHIRHRAFHDLEQRLLHALA